MLLQLDRVGCHVCVQSIGSKSITQDPTPFLGGWGRANSIYSLLFFPSLVGWDPLSNFHMLCC